MVQLDALEGEDFGLVDLEREEAEEAEEAAAKVAAKRERAKKALGLLGSRFQRVDDAAGSPRTPHAAAAAAPPLTSPRGEGAETWAKKSPRFFPDLDSGKLTSRPDLEKLARKRAAQLRFGGYSDKGAAIDAKIGGRIGGYSLLDDSAGLQSAVTQLFEHPPRPGSPRRQVPDLTTKPPLPRPPKPPQTARPRQSAAERAEVAKAEATRRDAAEAQQARLSLGVEEQVAVMVVRRDALLKRRAESLLGGRQRAFDADEEFRRSEEKHAAGEELRRERRRRLREQAETRRREEVEAQQAKLLVKLGESEQARAAQQVLTRAAEEAARESAAEEARHGRQIEATRRRHDQLAAETSRQARTVARNVAVGRYEEYRQSAEQGAAERYGAEVAARRAKARLTLDAHDGGRQRVEEQAEAYKGELEEQRKAVEERFQQESRVLAQQQDERAGRMRDQDKSERRHAAGVMERMRGMEAARVDKTAEQSRIMEERSAAQQRRCEVNHDGWVQYQALQAQNTKMRVEEAQAQQQARRERKQQANADKADYIASLAAARARRDTHIRNLAQEFAAKQARHMPRVYPSTLYRAEPYYRPCLCYALPWAQSVYALPPPTLLPPANRPLLHPLRRGSRRSCSRPTSEARSHRPRRSRPPCATCPAARRARVPASRSRPPSARARARSRRRASVRARGGRSVSVSA